MHSDSITIISDEVSQDLPEIARFVREFNLPGIELRSMFGRAFRELSDQDVDEIRRTAKAEGWKIHGCATPVFKCPIDDPAAIGEHVEVFKRSLDVAATLECDLLRIFTFLRLDTKAANLAAIPRVAELLHRLLEIAEGSQVRLGIENELSCIVGAGDELQQLFARLPDARFGIVWDPCNIVYLRDEPLPVTENFAELCPRIFHIHVKDAIRRQSSDAQLGAVSMPVGLGDVGWRTHLRDIRDSAYRGILSLETHWRVQQIDESQLHLPAGYPFSHGGYEASRTCIHNLRALLA